MWSRHCPTDGTFALRPSQGRVSDGFDLSNPTRQRTATPHGKVIVGTPLSESRNRWRLTLADWVLYQAKWQW